MRKKGYVEASTEACTKGQNLTLRRSLARLHAPETLLELPLGGVELGEGAGQMLHLLVQLLLHLGELLRAEAIEANLPYRDAKE